MSSCAKCKQPIDSGDAVTFDESDKPVHCLCPSEAERSGGVQPCFISATGSAEARADAPDQVDELARSFRATSGFSRLEETAETFRHLQALAKNFKEDEYKNGSEQSAALWAEREACWKLAAEKLEAALKNAGHCKGQRALARNGKLTNRPSK